MEYGGGMRAAEWIAIAFFAYIALAAAIRRLPPARRLVAGGGALAMAAIVVAISRLEGSIVRDWAPGAYLLAGYYLSGRTFVEPMPTVEAWLITWDRRLLGDHEAQLARWPRSLVAFFDAAYIGCFLLVPAGFAALVAADRADLADRYWTTVVGAEFGSFATLPYVQTRPPWVLERLAEIRNGTRRRRSVTFMKHATTGANTLPSGHAAGSLAVALAVIDTLPAVGSILLVLAVVIALATIVTRAHYVVDVLTGALLAVGVWLLVRAAGV
jgi:membrane-associated phospholipid phosphatase